MQEFTKWHDWEVTGFLGQGSFGKVYKIERTAYGHTYKSALKVIKIPSDPQQYDNLISTGMTHEDAKEYFNDMAETISSEFALMSEFRGNSNIVSFEDFEVIPEDDGYSVTIYIRMELLETLIHYMKNNTMTRKDVIQLGCDVLKALEMCEQRNIIHRDIKPENVFRSDQGTFKLGDFGIARELDRGDSGMSKKGTISYMAPEVYRGLPYGSNVDVYSLGIMLYRLMNNNRLPFLPPYPEKIKYTDTEQANIRRISGEELPLPCNAQDDFGDIILRACRFDPESRYQSASEMREDLEKLVAGTYRPVPVEDIDEDDDEATVGYPLAAEADSAGQVAEPIEAVEKSESAAAEIPVAAAAGAIDTEKNALDVEPAAAEKSDENSSDAAKPKKEKGRKDKKKDKAIEKPEKSESKPVDGTRKKISIGKIVAIAAAAVVAVIALLAVIGSGGLSGKVEIAGWEYAKDTTAILINSDEDLSVEEIQKIDKLSDLEEIKIKDCTLNDEEIAALGDLKVGVTRLIIHNCTGFTDISPLADMPFLGFLNLSSCGITDEMLAATDFGKMEHLVALRLQNNPDISTLDNIEAVIPQLQGLSISKTSISDISKLSGANELMVLLAADCGIDDLSPVTSTKIKYINIARNSISDIEVMKNMSNLKYAEITDNNVSDLSPLAGHAELDTLKANGNDISDLSPLATCSALATLQVCGNKLTSLEGLAGHSSLSDFYANNNDLTSLKGLENELDLLCLSASGNKLTDMEGTENLTQLQTVNLEDNDIEDISVLKKSVSSLEWVDISGNPVGSLDALGGTTHLTALYCDDTGIDSIKAIDNDYDLKELSAQNNDISSIDVLSDKSELIAIDLSGNKISDMSPLAQVTYDSMDDKFIDLQDNDIATIYFPETDGWYRAELAIAGNPVSDVELSDAQMSDEIDLVFLGITYYDGMEGASWAKYLYSGTRVYVTDCPLDKQVSVRDALREAVLDDYISFTQKSDIEDYIAPRLYEVKNDNGTVLMNEKYGKNANITEEDDEKELDEMEDQF